MSKKKPSVGDPGDGPPEPDKRSPLERDAEREEENIVKLLASEQLDGGFVELRRQAPNETEYGYLGRMNVANFSQENVKKSYGGGDYKCQIKSRSGVFKASTAFKIDYSIPTLYPGAAKKETEPMDRTPELVTALTTAMRSALPPPPPPQDNTILIKMMELMMTNRAPAVDPNIAAAMAELRAEIRELRNRNESGGGGDPFSKFISMSAKIDEMVARRMDAIGDNGGNGEAAPTDWKAKLLDIFGPLAAAMMMKGMNIDPNGNQPLTAEQQAAMQAAIADQAQPQLPAGALPANATTLPAQPVTDMNPLFKIYLVEFRRVALAAAAKGRDALDWADDKIDEIDPKYHEQIFTLANKETWFAEFFGPDANAQAHYAWLLDMRNMILTRWFVGDAVKAYGATPRAEPDVYAAAFLDRASVSFHEALWDSTDAEAWKEIFAAHQVDAVWLEKLRAAFEKALDPDDEKPAEPVTPPAPAAAGGSHPAGKKTAAAKKPKHKAGA